MDESRQRVVPRVHLNFVHPLSDEHIPVNLTDSRLSDTSRRMLQIDVELAERGSCPRCDSDELKYEGYVRAEPWSYRAFSVCPDCLWVKEF